MRVAQRQSSSAPQIANALAEMYVAAPPSGVTACLCVHTMLLFNPVWTVIGASALVPDRFGWGMRLCCSAPRLLLSDRPLSHSFVIIFLCHYLQLRTLGVLFLLVSTSICYHISTGAGIFVNTGDDGSVPTGVLPNNGIVIARNVGGGDRFIFQCRSGSTVTDIGDIIGLDGNALPIDSSGPGVTTGGLNVRRVSPATVFVRNPASEPAVDEGVYTCRIPDETGNDVDVNIGVFQNGFNCE